MAKRFKLKFSRVIPSLQFCRSKHPSTFPENPLPATHRLSPVNPKSFDISFPNHPAPPPSTPEHSLIKRHLSSKITSGGCGCRSGSCTHDLSSEYSTESPNYKWVKETKRHVVAGTNNEPKPQHRIHYVSFSDDSNGDMLPVFVNESNMNKASASVSSSGESSWFSSEGEESQETETFMTTSRSFSIDTSSEFDRSLDSITEKSNDEVKNRKKKSNNAKKIRKLRRYASNKWKGSNSIKRRTVPSPETESPVRASIFQRMIPCTVDGKVRESVAVVKKSKDPYEDFKSSMMEMILEKQMFDAKELEQLLQCLLSLNSRHYHGVIVEAFSEIWEVLFCELQWDFQA